MAGFLNSQQRYRRSFVEFAGGIKYWGSARASMSQQGITELIEDWQTGAFILIGSALVGFVSTSLLNSVGYGNLSGIGFIVGAILAFLSFSYLLYGR